MIVNSSRGRSLRKQLIVRRLFNRLMMFALLLTIALILSPRPVFAKETIQFPTDELASESVLPVFDRPEAVKSRLVSTAKRIEIGVFGQYAMTEAFYSPFAYGAMLTYHFNENHAINMLGSLNLSGISNYAQQLNPIPVKSGTPSAYAHLEYAPAPKNLLLANYQYTAFYGKISLAKDYVMNLHLYGLLGAGMMSIGDMSAPVVSIGMGQKFYLGRSFAVRFDLRGLAYNGPDVLSINLSGETKEVSSARFDKTLQFGTLLSAGVVYLLPSF